MLLLLQLLWSNYISTSRSKFVHALRRCIILTFARLKRDTAIADLEAAAKASDREKLVGRVPREGDLFGVRAIQHGYFGGVAQSRDGSPAPSNYAMSYKSGHNASSSIASSVAEYPYPRSQNLSVTSLPRRPEPTKQFPSPLRLHPSDAQSIRSISMGPIDTTASVGGKGGAYIPPLSLPRTFGRDSPAFGEEKPWVSPLDVHFSRPSTPKTQPASELDSNLPRVNFPGHIEKTGLVVPTPAGSLFGAQSEKASIVSSNTAASGMPSKETLAPKQPVVATNPTPKSTQSSESPSPFDFAFSSSQQEFRPPVSQIPTNKFAPEQPLLLNNLPRHLSSIDPNLFPQKSAQRNTSTAIIRDSVVIKQRVSIYRPAHPEEHVPKTPTTIHKRNSTAGSSIYSSNEDTPSSPIRAAIPEPEPQPIPELPPRSAARDRSRSTSTGRKSIARTHDSIRLTSKKSSQQSLTPPESNKNKRHSRERDTMHYDPSQTRRTRSSSIQGRAIDFDHPRESPFSNAHSISSHSANSSVSSSATTTPRIGSTSEPFALKVPSVPTPDPPIMNFEQADRLSVNVLPFKQHKGKTPSETSQNSIGDFYDAYYRNSTMAQRSSQVPPPLSMPPVNSVSIGGGHTRRAAPAPLKLGPGSVGGGGLAVGTIMEVATPNVSPLPERRGGGERFI